MNSFMGGSGLGTSGSWDPVNGGSIDPNYPIYTKESQMKLPSRTWLTLDEDQQSINDGMFFMDVGGAYRFLDLPSRNHCGGYGINFNDGHAEIYKLMDAASINWVPGGPRPAGGFNDWQRLKDVTTHPL